MVVPTPEMLPDQYFNQDLSEEEAEYGEEEEVNWNCGTVVVTMVGGQPEVLYSCRAEVFGGIVVEIKLREMKREEQGWNY